MEQCVHIIFIDVSFSPDDMENTVQGPSCNIRGTINKGIETLSLAFGDISQGNNGYLG